MDFGFTVAARGPLSRTQALSAMAKFGEQLGFAYIGVTDHIVIPRDIASRYPYSETGAFPGGASGECLELLTTLAFLAGITQKAKLLTTVMVVPHRPAVFTAKALATADVLSNGRVVVGCGVGWMKEEFEAIGAPPYEERGAVGSEYIRAFKELWTSDNPTFDGKYTRFSNISFLPKPVQKPHPPIWVGGESPAALRRAAGLGDAWYPIGNNPQFPLQTPELYAKSLERLRGFMRERGRDPASIDQPFNVSWYNERKAQTMPDGRRLPFTGATEQIVEDIRALGRLGVTHMVFNFQAQSLEETLPRMERFAREIMPRAAR